MNSNRGSHETIYSAGTSHAEIEIEQRATVNPNNNVATVYSKPDLTNKIEYCPTSNNGNENKQSSSNKDKNLPSSASNADHTIKSVKVPTLNKSSVDLILQHPLHPDKNVPANEELQTNELNQTRESQSLNGTDPIPQDSVSSNSSLEDRIIPNAITVCDNVNCEETVPNRRLEGVVSDSNLLSLHRNPSRRNLVQTRSENRVSNNVEVELERLRDEYIRTQAHTISRFQRDVNHAGLESVPETSQAPTASRNNSPGNRILKYYRSLRGSVDTERETSTSTAQQTSPQTYYATPPLAEAPPTYSAVIRNDDTDDALLFLNRNAVGVQQSPPFIAPRPPPTYAEAEGFNLERPMFLASSNFVFEQLVWGPEPTYIVCPRCAHLILTTTHTRISSVNHVSAIILCLCGCWPCCFIPYCIDSCKNTYHYCPNCSLFLGVYRPW